MTDGSSFGAIGGLFLLGAVSTCGWWYMDVDSKRSEAMECRKALDILQAAFDDKRKAIESVKAKCNELQALIDTKAAADNSIGSLQSTREAVLGEFVAAVRDVRNKSIGTGMPTLQLPSGEMLHAVTIQNVNDSTISMAHSGGVARLRPSELPEVFRQRFRPGMFPMTTPVATKAEVAKTPVTAPAPPLSPRPQAGARIKIEIDDLEKKVLLLAENKTVWKARAEALHTQALQAQSTGKPSYNYSSQAASAERNIRLIDSQIYDLQSQMTDLRKKMFDANASP